MDKSSEAGLRIRPRVDLVPWKALTGIMEKCWDHDPNMRPSASEVVGMLESIPGADQLVLDASYSTGPCCTVS